MKTYPIYPANLPTDPDEGFNIMRHELLQMFHSVAPHNILLVGCTDEGLVEVTFEGVQVTGGELARRVMALPDKHGTAFNGYEINEVNEATLYLRLI